MRRQRSTLTRHTKHTSLIDVFAHTVVWRHHFFWLVNLITAPRFGVHGKVIHEVGVDLSLYNVNGGSAEGIVEDDGEIIRCRDPYPATIKYLLANCSYVLIGVVHLETLVESDVGGASEHHSLVRGCHKSQTPMVFRRPLDARLVFQIWLPPAIRNRVVGIV